MNNQPYPDQNLPAIAASDDEVLAAIALELSRVYVCGQCHGTVPPLIDNIARLVGEITRLRDVLITERLTSANLLAAMRAALGAAADGEADPLVYLRDELPGESGGTYGA